MGCPAIGSPWGDFQGRGGSAQRSDKDTRASGVSESCWCWLLGAVVHSGGPRGAHPSSAGPTDKEMGWGLPRKVTPTPCHYEPSQPGRVPQ